MHSLLQSEIFEVRLTLDCLFCPYCETNVQNILKEVKGVENSKVWSMEGLAVVTLTTIAMTAVVTNNFSVLNVFSFNNQMLRKVC